MFHFAENRCELLVDSVTVMTAILPWELILIRSLVLFWFYVG